MKKKVFSTFLCILLLLVIPLSMADELHDSHADIPICGIYFTGIGCPHCAKVEPVIKDLLNQTPNLVLIKYEIYQEQINAPLLQSYASTYNTKPGIPIIIFNENDVLVGDIPIILNLQDRMQSYE